MASGQALFAEFFTYVLLFEPVTAQGEQELSTEQVRQEIAALLARQQAAAKRTGMPEIDYQEARFAIIAWADETLLKHTAWAHHSAWSALPLQLEYYQTRNAGEEFFERLERLRPEQQAVREIYYVCLGLGFSGQYFLGLENALKLDHIRHEQARRLPHAVEALHAITTLTPQPYAVASPQGQPIIRPLTSQFLKVTLGLLLAVPLGLFVTYKLLPPPAPTSASPGVQPVVLPQPAPPDAPCAPRTIGNVPEPLCAVIKLLEPLKQRGEGQDLGLRMYLNKSDSVPSYVARDDLAIRVHTPSKFDSFVYVDYYSADGTVVHLFPTPQEAMQHFGRSQELTVKQLNGQPLEIQAPFGIELITVVASQTRLFLKPRAGAEDREAYVNALRQALLQEEVKTTITATFSLLTTRDNQ
jgi:type IV/VI secretion system ImpK/VasF family protein